MQSIFKAVVSKMLIILICFYILQVNGANDAPIVEIFNGKIRGLERESNNETYYSFEGIPYAEPPTGEKRFESPTKYETKWTDIRDATKLQNICIHYIDPMILNDTLVGDEDCLYVNVYTPDISNTENLYPVIFFIHGGGFKYGSGNDLKEDILMKHQNMIFVTFNYRLGAFGFLSTGDTEIAGNMGLKDQRLALRWVKENIRKFNGNPEQIMLCGFSAGAASVEYLTFLPEIETLANSAYAMSGSSLNNWALNEDPKTTALKFSEFVKCPFNDTKEIKNCLKKIPADDVAIKSIEFLSHIKKSLGIFVPVVESQEVTDAFITDFPKNLLKDGKYCKIPYLASYCADDGALMIPTVIKKIPNIQKPENEIEFEELKTLAKKYNKNMKNILEDAGNDKYSSLIEMYTKFTFTDGIIESLRLRREHNAKHLYSYVYDNPAPFGLANIASNRTDFNFGTVHGDDVFLIFNYPLRDAVPFRDDEKIISDKFVEMIESFITTGMPRFGEIEIPQINSNADGFKYLHITRDKSIIEHY